MIDSLQAIEEATLAGAARLEDDELAGRLAELVDAVATDDVDEHERAYVLRELAGVCLVTARRIEA